MHRLYQQHLERAGWSVVECWNGREVVETAVREQPDAVVVELFLPELDGLAVVSELRRSESTRGVPVVVITADLNYYQHRQSILNRGAKGMLMKPFSPAQLLQVLERLRPAVLASA